MADIVINAQQKHKLKAFIKELKQYSAPHTELVTVYIPAGYDINKVIGQLSEEQGTASNIKSTSTRKNVQGALERMIQHLRLYKQTPAHGLAAFSGNVAAREGQQDVRVWSIEPPIPINMRTYRCDKQFVLDVLDEMMEEKSIYGLVVIDRRDAHLALLKGKSIIPLTKTHSHVPGKFKAGGQCLLPDTLIETNSSTPLHEIKVGDSVQSYNFATGIIEHSEVTDVWLTQKSELFEILTEDGATITASKDHLIFVQEGETKYAEELSPNDLLLKVKNGKVTTTKIKTINKIKRMTDLIDISVKNQNFIANGIIVHNSAQRFERLIEGAAKDHYRKVAEYMKEQFLGMKDLKGIILGGPGPTKYNFLDQSQLTTELKKKIIAIKDLSYTEEFGLQELVDKSQDVLAQEEIATEKKLMNDFFLALAKTQHKVAYGKKDVEKAIDLGAVDVLLLSESLDDAVIDELTEKAGKFGSSVALISTATREGAQLRDLGGVAAMLRFEVHN